MEDNKELGREDEETQEPLLDRKPQPIIVKSSKDPDDMEALPQVDLCSELMGSWGKWQLKVVSLLYLTKIPAAWFMACIIFTAPFPWYNEYRCDVSKYENDSEWTSITYPQTITSNGSYQNDYCQVILGTNKTDVVVPCDSYVYDLDIYTTLITQFDLVCTRNILIAITQCFHLFGVLIGGIAANELMVFYSPKFVMMVGILLLIPCGLATGFVPWFWIHVMFRCLAAACCALIFTPGGVIFSDIISGRSKTIVSANFEQFWSIGVVLLPAIGYFTNKWSEIYITISSPAIPFFVMWFWLPDSPRWHLEKGNIEKVQSILENAAHVNNLEAKIPDNLTEQLEKQSKIIMEKNSSLRSQNNWRHLISLPGGFQMILAAFTSWSLMLTCYYGTLLNIRSFGREYLYVNTAIAGFCEIAGGIVGFMILLYCKNKWKIVGGFTSITGLVNCIIWLLPSYVDGSHYLSDLLIISMLNKIGISACLCVLTTCTAELFPIPHKKRIIYGCTVSGRIVFLTAPLIGAMVKYGDAAPLCFFGVLTTIGGLCAFIMKPVNSKVENLPKKIFTIENKL